MSPTTSSIYTTTATTLPTTSSISHTTAQPTPSSPPNPIPPPPSPHPHPPSLQPTSTSQHGPPSTVPSIFTAIFSLTPIYFTNFYIHFPTYHTTSTCTYTLHHFSFHTYTPFYFSICTPHNTSIFTFSSQPTSQLKPFDI
ncbi:hypothetical protein KP509_02G033200 [Ceratopteris richardii]|uniref:Uncharacterized protein n=1 Tax=Ceratopteris richardii TaxID=49495 RepID=A0A8T2VCP8_CERRI|nr:hypothetical protein KP509_02G033200 [Ceratopteris richardii]